MSLEVMAAAVIASPAQPRLIRGLHERRVRQTGLRGCSAHLGRWPKVQRRALLAFLTLGLADVLTGCSRPPSTALPAGSPPGYLPFSRASVPEHPSKHATRPGVGPDPSGFPAPHPGLPKTVAAGPAGSTRKIAITIDDGYDPQTVAAYVEFARSTGTHLTF